MAAKPMTSHALSEDDWRHLERIFGFERVPKQHALTIEIHTGEVVRLTIGCYATREVDDGC